MASDAVPVGGFSGNGINLANYFPHQRSFNTVVYVHKRFLEDPKDVKNKEATSKLKFAEKKKKDKHDKGQQFGSNKYNTDNFKSVKPHKVGVHNDSVIEHTIKFAKDIVPLVIPGRDKSPVFYTVKTSKKSKKKAQIPRESSNERTQQATYETGKSKKIIETYRKEFKSNRDSFSIKESISHSENDTFDDLNINQSLSCTFSEVSGRKCQRKGSRRNKEKDVQKLTLSESFEALATEMNASGDTKIKVHLMNDQDKYQLSETIRVPIMNAIKECLLELSTSNADVKTAQKFIKYNSQKLDNILDKLTSIERKLDDHAKSKSPRIPFKASTLEQLGEDLLEVHETSEEEEMCQTLNERRSKGAVVDFIKTSSRVEKRIEEGCGEVAGRNASCSTDVKFDRPNRIPARFCWTDADRNN